MLSMSRGLEVGMFVRYQSQLYDCMPSISTGLNLFDFTTAGDWDCVAAVERLPALHYSVDFIFLSFGIMGVIVEL